MDRREFLKSASLGGALLGIGRIAGAQDEERKPVEGGVQKYNVLGRTGWKASDVSLGGGGLKDPAVVERAVDLGINYFDTAPDYMPASEETLGKVLPKVRDKVFITTKMCEFGKYPMHLALHSPSAKYIECLEASLKRLQTDHVDALFVHAAGERPPNDAGETDIERLRDPEMLNAVEKLKKDGKMRFLGTSSHGTNLMEEGLDYAIECGQYDLFMASWNFMKFKDLQKVIDKAKARNVGVVAMKTIPGAKASVPEKMKGLSEEEVKVAALKWALSNPSISTLVKGVQNVEELNLYVTASGQKLTRRDEEVLRRYAAAITQSYCRTGCGECAAACPKGVAIPEIMRYNMYFEHYGHERIAMEAYNGMAAPCRAAECARCDAPCEAACPHGLPMKAMLAQAHSNLHFA